MDATLRSAIVGQFGAALAMLREAVEQCPDWLWDDRNEGPPFWQTAYHALYYLDLYLTDSVESFTPPPFHVVDAHRLETPPQAVFERTQVVEYIQHGWNHCQETFRALTLDRAQARCGIDWYDLTVAELLLLTLRHVQHHVGQLASTLRRRANIGLGWVGSEPDLGILGTGSE